MVSSPAFAGGVVVIGSDDGAVYGLDPSTGDRRWRYLAKGPVEAPVTAAGGVTYVASRSGELTALDARIEDPFSPVLGFTEVGIITIGLIWDALTIGFWANYDSPGLPRVSRILLYLQQLAKRLDLFASSQHFGRSAFQQES